ncbi:uridine-cytidine kinase-like 1 isoform X25 [Pongo pygmaeus]|uniref:uridine-cytidine kinase-like 1 isoform X25 n=1 Tax=Pongo pygmaeus TaxID=9600 RepID=UPI00300D4D36
MPSPGRVLMYPQGSCPPQPCLLRGWGDALWAGHTSGYLGGGQPWATSEHIPLCSSNAESLDRLLPPVGTGRSPRKRTTSQCKSEPPLLRTSKRTIYTAGRPPWYNEHGTQSKEAFAIGLGGGSASGKTTVARMIIEALDVPWVVLLSMDSFYKVLTEQQQEQAAHNNFNFDHPDAFDFDLIISTLKKLKQGKSVKVPIYDFTTHSRKKDWKTLYGANVIIFEGIMAFADKTLLEVSTRREYPPRWCLSPGRLVHELLDMKIFVDTDSDIRLVRRLRRDISERGRDIEGVIKQYNKFVKPSFDQYIQPTMRLADIVVPRGSGNTVAIDLIVQHMHSQLEEVPALSVLSLHGQSDCPAQTPSRCAAQGLGSLRKLGWGYRCSGPSRGCSPLSTPSLSFWEDRHDLLAQDCGVSLLSPTPGQAPLFLRGSPQERHPHQRSPAP